jgi:hypothetical protein
MESLNKPHTSKIFRDFAGHCMKMKTKNIFFKKIPLFTVLTAICFFVIPGISLAQCPSPDVAPYTCGPPAHCDCQVWPNNGIILETSPNVSFEFDKINEYAAGITYSGSTILHIKMDSINRTCIDGSPCMWKLVMYVDDFGAAGGQWDKLTTYGTGAGTVPSIDLLQVRVYNGCNTPICESFQSFAPVDDASIDIINSAVLKAAGTCGTNVDGVGSYLNHYNEYTFMVDYRIVPHYGLAPGNYQIALYFCLVED